MGDIKVCPIPLWAFSNLSFFLKSLFSGAASINEYMILKRKRHVIITIPISRNWLLIWTKGAVPRCFFQYNKIYHVFRKKWWEPTLSYSLFIISFQHNRQKWISYVNILFTKQTVLRWLIDISLCKYLKEILREYHVRCCAGGGGLFPGSFHPN